MYITVPCNIETLHSNFPTGEKKKEFRQGIPCIVVANKIDLDLKVTKKSFNFASKRNLPFYFVSASEGFVFCGPFFGRNFERERERKREREREREREGERERKKERGRGRENVREKERETVRARARVREREREKEREHERAGEPESKRERAHAREKKKTERERAGER